MFNSSPETIAAGAPAPAAKALSAANCAAPAKTTIDITMGATAPITGSASTPNEMPSVKVASANGRPARTPARRPVTGSSTWLRRCGFSGVSAPPGACASVGVSGWHSVLIAATLPVR